ncbi:amino acid ABC transporter substrate-binding protein (PAAT family) [Motilibacter rhizosphaerae]|uniref:Amino acid ABC transporter substrate-binding protein (PAAT family) n=1 Tax=Motilibacter rhizosphaerae TaxID=598652 RepID=A0A4Q7NSI6_9ACTN|nr:transporter substrate-binding domain-containing protein [Motilibacter rhizosphaerae]RZS89924.1 amino acid ABC transporter substrate-binding protein (PAAT family) [Motilibacter rhizosphaerae]
MPSPARTPLGLAAAAALAATVLSGCGSSTRAQDAASSTSAGGSTAAAGTTSVLVGGNAGSLHASTPVTLSIAVDQAARAELPADVVKRGTLVIGEGALPTGFPPLAFVGDDKRTLTGAEPDLGRLVAATLGLKPVITNATWDNLFVGIDSGKTDVGFSNITDTEKRKEKYDFASYRQDNLGFQVLASSTWQFAGDYHNLAGLTVAVGSGTNQEKILLEWQSKVKAEGKKLNGKFYTDDSTIALALRSKQVDAYLGPNPSIAYANQQSRGTASATRTAGTYSGAGASLQGLIAATTKKGDGLNKPVADAINTLIANGTYAKWLAAWNLSNEAVKTAEINPPGLPITNS